MKVAALISACVAIFAVTAVAEQDPVENTENETVVDTASSTDFPKHALNEFKL